MARNVKALLKNRTDVSKGAARPLGQPNGRPSQALVPTGLPYGEHSQLTKQIAASPRAPGPAQRPPPTSTDLTQPGPLGALVASRNAQPRRTQPVTPMLAPTERPTEPLMAGAIGQPDAILGQPQPQAVSPLLQQVSMLTGSTALAELATRLQAAGS